MAQVSELAPELVLVVKGAFLEGEAVQAWRRAGLKVANVFPDNPFDVMGAMGTGARLLEHLRACDRVYVHDRFLVGQLRQLGVRSVFIAFARDPELHDRIHVAAAGAGHVRVAFVGNPDPERIRFLRAVADLGLGLWGAWHWAGFTEGDPLGRCVQGGVLLGQDMTRALGAATVSINVLRYSQKTAHNMRTFESPACGVCTISEASNGVLELMEDGQEVVTFRTPEELRKVTLELLDDPRRTARIAEAGWRRVEGETYARRAQQILADLA